MCQSSNLDPARVILLWMFSKGWAVLAKSDTESRIASNIQMNGLSLTDEQISKMDELCKCPPLKICWDPHGYV